MGHIFCMMGKSATGKDSLYRRILADPALALIRIVTYTTRPIREGEEDGREYHFVTLEQYEQMKRTGKVIESRCYHTVFGDWYYFTADDGQISENDDYLLILTLEGYSSLRDFFGNDRVIPIYIEVEDGLRLERALAREKMQKKPAYAEMCRRFLADSEDFSEENLAKLGIDRRFENVDFETCARKISDFIASYI